MARPSGTPGASRTKFVPCSSSLPIARSRGGEVRREILKASGEMSGDHVVLLDRVAEGVNALHGDRFSGLDRRGRSADGAQRAEGVQWILERGGDRGHCHQSQKKYQRQWHW